MKTYTVILIDYDDVDCLRIMVQADSPTHAARIAVQRAETNNNVVGEEMFSARMVFEGEVKPLDFNYEE